MSGIYYALSIAAIFIVIHWYIRNDAKSPSEPTTGLLAVKDHKVENETAVVGTQQDARSIRFPVRTRRSVSAKKSD
ncbi:MAG TPA: hypothetical protein VHW02_14620 [Rhizomicrobium sp.]|jgi:hypothetical protein|nr:hypothetical protein [Rhizomicrobium sp.]